MPQDFFTVADEQGVHVIELVLPDVIDSAEFDQLNESMQSTLEGKSNERWVLDLSQVQYMGSAVLGFMVNIRQQIKQAQGRLALFSLFPLMTDVFRAYS